MTERATLPPPTEIEAHLYTGDDLDLLAWCPEAIVLERVPGAQEWTVTSMYPEGPRTETLRVDQYLAIDHHGAARVIDREWFEEMFRPAGEP